MAALTFSVSGANKADKSPTNSDSSILKTTMGYNKKECKDRRVRTKEEQNTEIFF